MVQTLILLDGDAAVWGPAVQAGRLRDCFLRDTLDLAGRLADVEVRILSATALASLQAPIADGPVVVLAPDVPHLPIWRLRDAFTHLQAGATLVLGPAQQGGHYLVGLGAGRLGLLPAAAAALAQPALARPLACADVTLPSWYRLATVEDLRRLADDLRPMPVGVVARTRALLDEGLRARAVGE